MSYRSKSYHGDLNCITPSVFTGLSDYSSDLMKSDRSLSRLSRSAYNLNSNNNYRCSLSSIPSTSYVNAYSKHHNHHNHLIRIPSQPINSRCRFQKRNAYKAYRSRSVNPSNEMYDFSSSGYHSNTLRSSIPRISTSQDLYATAPSSRYSKSLSEIRVSQSRNTYDSIPRSSSTRNIFDDSRYNNNILNPDVYVRWLRNKREMDNFSKRHILQSSLQLYDDFEFSRRARDISSYSSSSKKNYFSYTQRQLKSPTFTKTIKGKQKTISFQI